MLYASLPAILYLNATWAGYLLRPLLEFEASALYSQTFAAPDLGNSYPSAVGNTAPAISSAIESTSDMLIMAWAHATFTGDGSLISQYVRPLRSLSDGDADSFTVYYSDEMGQHTYFRESLDPQWLVCLPPYSSRCYVNSAPLASITADGLSSPNMTNLAIKGILAIRTMAEISRTLGMSSDYDSYSVCC